MSVSNRDKVIEKLSEKVAGLTKKDANIVLNGLLDSIMDLVANGEKVSFVGFGSFEARTRAPRAGRNPQTGEPIQIPAHTVPVFKPGKKFRDCVKK